MSTSSKNQPKVANMDLEAWAVLSATVEHYPSERRPEVLERLGHSRGAWDKLSRAGNLAVFAAVDSGDVKAVARFGHLLDATKRRLTEEKTPIEALGPLSDASEPAPSSPPPPRRSEDDGEGGEPTELSFADTIEELPPTRRSGLSFVVDESGTLPVASPSLAHPILTLQQYACFRAEIVDAQDDQAIARIQGCYGLDRASDEAETYAWKGRFTDRDMFRQYRTLFEYYRAVLSRRCG